MTSWNQNKQDHDETDDNIFNCVMFHMTGRAVKILEKKDLSGNYFDIAAFLIDSDKGHPDDKCRW